jgi:hypothetical protein
VNDVPLSIRAAMALSEGKTLRSHLCIAEPKTHREIILYSVANGFLSADGGSFRTHKAGYVRIIATEFDGEIVISKPSKPSYVPRGILAEIGPTVLAPKKEEQK